MNCKANLSIVLFVVMVVVLAGACLFVFNMNTNQDTKELRLGSIDEVYLKQNHVNFYLKNVFDKSLPEITNVSDFDKNQFINKFKQELNVLGNEEIKKIGSELENKNIQIDKNNNLIHIKLNVTVNYNHKNDFIVLYNYNSEFEKVFK
jgi:hypothetical protein